jgi:hypothetical protein
VGRQKGDMLAIVPFALLASSQGLQLIPHSERANPNWVVLYGVPSVDIWVENASVEDVLKSLSGQMKIARTDVPLRGKVSAKLINVPGNEALNEILAPLGAQTFQSPTFPFVVIDRLAPDLTPRGGPMDAVVTLNVKNVDIRTALRHIANQGNFNYTVATGLDGIVSVNAVEQPAGKVLQSVLGQVDGTFRVDGGIYNFIPKNTPVNADRLKTALDGKVGYFLARSETRQQAISRFSRQAGISLTADQNVDLSESVTALLEGSTAREGLGKLLGPKYIFVSDKGRLRITKR